MKKIVVIRHAKAIGEIYSSDFERIITDKGVERTFQVAQKSKHLVNNNFTIWSSSAMRTSQTAQLCVKVWLGEKKTIIYDTDLYTFEVTKLLQIIKKCSDSVENLIIFGHNFALTDLVNQYGSIYIDSIPTSGLVSIFFESDSWQNISNGITTDIIFPDKN